MKLRELDAFFVFNVTKARLARSLSESVEGMQGIQFQCPTCSEGLERGEEDGRRFVRGSHYVLVLFSNPRGVEAAPADAHHRNDGTQSPRWEVSGSSLDDLTLKPSINCDIPWKDDKGVEHPSSCKWHGFVTAGDAA